MESINNPQASEAQSNLLPLQLTSTYLYDPALINTKFCQSFERAIFPVSRLSLGRKDNSTLTLPTEREHGGRDLCRAQHSAWNGTRSSTHCAKSRTIRFLCTTELSSSAVRPLSRITVSLYAEKRTRKKDILLGRQEIACVPQHGLSIS
jgi:hypothetical protein